MPDDVVSEQVEAKGEVRRMKRERSTQAAEILKQSLSTSLKRSMDLDQEKGASTWLTSLPIQEFGFTLHKRDFQDTMALCYNCQPLRAPLLVPAVQNSPLNTLCPALSVGSPPFGTMKFRI